MGYLMFPLALLCLALVSGVGSLKVTISQPLYEFARGDNVTLSCSFQSTLSKPGLVVITWSAVKIKGEEENTKIATYYSLPAPRTDYAKEYEGRAKLDVNLGTGKANLRLYKITMTDNRKYECDVLIPGDDEGSPVDSTEVVVLVAPTPPICKTVGNAIYGQDIQLTCLSEEGSPPPQYTWERRNTQNAVQMHDPKTTDKGGVLSLFNITRETSGYYICTSKNKIRSATCNHTLAVVPPSILGGSVGQTAGIIAGVVGGLLILIIVICCCCKKRRKAKEEAYAMAARDEEYRDKEPTENGERREVQDDNRGERDTRERRDYDDRRSDYDDRRSDYNDRRSDYDDRRSDYDDRRSDYTERRSDYDDRRSDYSERRDRYDDDRDRRDRRYDDDRRDRRYDDDRRDRRYDDDRHYDEAYDDRPPVPNNKPPRQDFDV